MREQHRGQVIYPELHFVTVFGELLLGGHHAGIVDQHINVAQFLIELSGAIAYLFKVCQIQGKQAHFCLWVGVLDFGDGGLPLGLVAAGEDNLRAAAGQLLCRAETNAGIAAGDQYAFAHDGPCPASLFVCRQLNRPHRWEWGRWGHFLRFSVAVGSWQATGKCPG